MSLQMRRECERCQAALEDGGAAFICSFECTFYEACADGRNRVCPNCGGDLVRRPRREGR